jgi:AsmA protein
MRAGKILGFVVAGLIAAIVLVLVCVWLFVNPNDYKAKMAAAVKAATGRDLVLKGDIKLSVFPWVALELGAASLGNPAGFSDQPFVSIQHATVRAKLLPLLQKRLEIARVEIDGLDLRLLKNAAGAGNWEGFGRPAAQGSAPAQGSDGAARQAERPLAGVAGIKLTHARVSYESVVLDNLSLETAPFADGVVPIDLRFDANRGIATEHATVEAKVDFSNPAGRHYRLAALLLLGEVYPAGNGRPLRWTVSMPGLDLDLDAQMLAVPSVALTVAGAELNGSVSGTKVLDDLTMTGSVTLAPLVLREFIPRWGLSPPQTRDARAFSSLSGSTAFAYGGNSLRLDTVQLALDQTHLQGNVADDLATKALTFNLSADQIDVDRYLAPEGQPPAPTQSVKAREPIATDSKATEAKTPWDVQGTVAVGSLHLSRLDLTNLKLTLTAKDGVTHLYPLQAQIDGGRYSGDVTLDEHGEVPVLSVDEHLTGIDVGKLLAGSGKSVHLSGKGNLSIRAAGHGETAAAVLKTLNGHAEGYVREGAVEGVDLGYQLSRAEALIKGGSTASLQDTRRTQFDAFKTSAQIVDGVAETKDLLISSQALKITGQGSMNLATSAINFELLADTLRTTQGVPIQIPVIVSGTTSNPTVRPDVEALAKGQLRQKLQDVLKDKLQGLFGKP